MKSAADWRLLVQDDPSRRRGIWMRSDGAAIELRAGREGDDNFVRLVPGAELTPDLLHDLATLLDHGCDPSIDYENGRERRDKNELRALAEQYGREWIDRILGSTSARR